MILIFDLHLVEQFPISLFLSHKNVDFLSHAVSNLLPKIALHRYQPASLRLVDNEQFRFGHALKPAGTKLTKCTFGHNSLLVRCA